MYLLINTSTKKHIALLDSKGIIFESYTGKVGPGSREFVTEIYTLLKETNTNIKDLAGIFINSGPGSFTGLKIGAAVANALSYALDIPKFPFSGEFSPAVFAAKANPLPSSVPLIPTYGGEPNIGKKK